jgi:hypothetical protein
LSRYSTYGPEATITLTWTETLSPFARYLDSKVSNNDQDRSDGPRNYLVMATESRNVTNTAARILVQTRK